MEHRPGPTEEAVSGRSAPSQSPHPEPAATPAVPPPAVGARDPVATSTHVAGGTYDKADFSPAARRSEVHSDQREPQPGSSHDRETRSGFEAAQGLEGPAGSDVDH